MAITKVWLDETEDECTLCGACEAMAPDVFEVPEKMIVVENPDLSQVEDIEEAADTCPVSTIAIEYDNSGQRDNND